MQHVESAAAKSTFLKICSLSSFVQYEVLMVKNKSKPVSLRKPSLVEIASSTLEKIKQGSYGIEGKTFNLSKTIE